MIIARLIGKFFQRSRAACPVRPEHFGSVVAIGPVPGDLLPLSIPQVAVPVWISPDSGNARAIIEFAAGLSYLARPCLVLTTCDLHVDNRISVFGYSDRSKQIAVISLQSLAQGVDSSTLANRLRNVMKHELGHLNGFAHCSGSCVMKPAHSAAELDDRPINACGHCPRKGWIETSRKVLAGVLLTVIVMAGNAILSHMLPPLATPFTCWAVDSCGRQSVTAAGPGDEVSIYFQRRKLITLFDRGGRTSLRERSMPAVEGLNAILRSARGARVSVLRSPQGRFAVGIPGQTALLEVLPGDVRGSDTEETTASKWAEALNYWIDHYAHNN